MKGIAANNRIDGEGDYRSSNTPNPLTAAIEESGLVQAILGALEYRGFYDAGKYLDDTILEHITPALEKIHAFGKQEGMEEALEDVAAAVSTNAAQEIIECGNAGGDAYLGYMNIGYMNCIEHTEVILNKRLAAVRAARTAHRGDSGKEVHDRAAD